MGSKIIAELLSRITHDDGITKFFVQGSSLFIGREPDGINPCTTIYDTGGGEQDARLAINESSFQVRTKSTYENAFNLSEIAKAYIQSIDPQVVDSIRVSGVWITTPSTFLFTNEEDLSIFVFNGRIITEPENKGNRI